MKNKEILPARFTTPEARLAIDCLGFELGVNQTIDIPEGMDWEKFYAFLESNRLAPHFAVLAKKLPIDFPEEIKYELKMARYQNLLYGDACKLQVYQVLARLREAGIPVIVLKGWAVIQWLYGGDHGQRVYDDIDILVPVKQKEAAEAILESEGFSPVNAIDPEFADRFSNAKAYILAGKEFSQGKLFSTGFHWGLTHFPYFDQSRIDTEELFDRRLMLLVAGVDVSELSLEDQLVYTCAHLALHHRNNETLLHYFEIAMMLGRAGDKLDWSAMVNRAVKWGFLVQMRVVMRVVNSIWVIPPLNDALSIIDQIRIPWKERQIDGLVTYVKGNRIRTALVEIIALPGFLNKWRAFWMHLLPSQQFMEQRYNSKGKSLLQLYWFRVKGASATLFHSPKKSR